jgi:hypothetical protein
LLFVPFSRRLAGFVNCEVVVLLFSSWFRSLPSIGGSLFLNCSSSPISLGRPMVLCRPRVSRHHHL